MPVAFSRAVQKIKEIFFVAFWYLSIL